MNIVPTKISTDSCCVDPIDHGPLVNDTFIAGLEETLHYTLDTINHIQTDPRFISAGQ